MQEKRQCMNSGSSIFNGEKLGPLNTDLWNRILATMPLFLVIPYRWKRTPLSGLLLVVGRLRSASCLSGARLSPNLAPEMA